MNDLDRVRSWRCDEDGRCWKQCPAAEAMSTRIECLVLGDVYGSGCPCPVHRLRVALGSVAPTTTATTATRAEPKAVEDRVVDALRAGPLDARQLRATVVGKAREVDAARDELVAAGAVTKSVSGARTIFALETVVRGTTEPLGASVGVAENTGGTRNDNAGDTPDANDDAPDLAALDAEFERSREVEGTAARPRKLRIDHGGPTS